MFEEPDTGQSPNPDRNRRRIRQAILYGLLVVLLVYQVFAQPPAGEETTLEQVREGVATGEVSDLVVHVFDRAVSGKWVESNKAFRVYYPVSFEEQLLSEFEEAGVDYDTAGPGGSAANIVLSILPMLVVGGLVLYAISRLSPQGIGGKKHLPVERPSQGFDSLGGIDEAIEEVKEVVDFLKDPSAFQNAGARPPRGVLLEGPPGTGKTALARAVAAEADVPFYSVSGSDFVEMFVGVGASRIRHLFQEARQAAPAIIFIDEIDAIGRRRAGAAGPGTNEETERTLNQLLVEMDGFDNQTGVILMAATNRVDTLDQALIRPGRFDRRIQVPLPDPAGRHKILEVHAKGRSLSEDIDFEVVAAQTTGFSGAQLEALLNEAAILVAREKGQMITPHHLQLALEKVALGPERRSARISDEDRRITACHEAGHAIVAWTLPDADGPRKVTIIPRGHTGGATWIVPSDRSYLSKNKGLAQLAVAMGGRAGEEALLGDNVTSGAEGDLMGATRLARRMVASYAMVPEVGLAWYGPADPFDPESPNVSETRAKMIEDKISELNSEALATARRIIAERYAEFEAMVELLLEREQVGTEEMTRLWGPMPERR